MMFVLQIIEHTAEFRRTYTALSQQATGLNNTSIHPLLDEISKSTCPSYSPSPFYLYTNLIYNRHLGTDFRHELEIIAQGCSPWDVHCDTAR